MSVVELAVGPRYRDLVGFRINRVWPTARRRLIGPFIFYDHMLPRDLPPGSGLDVPPHPHIGLATVTYLFDGELMHCDSLGTRQLIRPGDLNWMIAGRGITHSERTSDADRGRQSLLHGTQAWVALPRTREACAPDFLHVPGADIPERQRAGVRVRMLAGAGFGLQSPLPNAASMHYAEVLCDAGSALELPPELGQRAVYVVEGSLRCHDQSFGSGRLFVLADGAPIRLEAEQDARIMLLGGAPLSADRHIWWNFVASTQEQLAAARQRWADGEFPAVPGDATRMSMPEY